jgi:hypothetical protein
MTELSLQPPVRFDELLHSIVIGDVPGIAVDERFPHSKDRVLLTSGTGALELWRREDDAGFVFRPKYGDGLRTVLEPLAIFTGSKVSPPDPRIHPALRA